jgi:hypothetical protein
MGVARHGFDAIHATRDMMEIPAGGKSEGGAAGAGKQLPPIEPHKCGLSF